ncbi:hypothetical protein FLAT13_02629 [Flavobacterium salmonis]|uniref:Uncharacterized protein n=1 Tax=Flavobacterium salmonis TaxID=2654844 RepID=A0A6V6Z2M9_9FLAO|nr:hypothetical protein FLAT13_02629 [Flavobacterium salmonis]
MMVLIMSTVKTFLLKVSNAFFKRFHSLDIRVIILKGKDK